MSSAPSITATGWWGLPVSATLVAVAFIATGLEPRVIPALYLAVVTPLLAAADVREHRLPNSLVLPGFAAAAVGLVGQWVVTGQSSVTAIVSGVAYFLALLLLAMLGGMGMGDVKLAGVLGFAAGLVGPEAAVIAPLSAFLLGGVAALGALRESRGSSIPFGPYLLAGFWIALVVSRGASST